MGKKNTVEIGPRPTQQTGKIIKTCFFLSSIHRRWEVSFTFFLQSFFWLQSNKSSLILARKKKKKVHVVVVVSFFVWLLFKDMHSKMCVCTGSTLVLAIKCVNCLQVSPSLPSRCVICLRFLNLFPSPLLLRPHTHTHTQLALCNASSPSSSSSTARYDYDNDDASQEHSTIKRWLAADKEKAAD